MADRPILFSGPMVRALLEGTKTQTRRMLNPQPVFNANGSWRWDAKNGGFVGAMGSGVDSFPKIAAYHNRIKIGDRLYVREAWSGIHVFHNTPPAQRERMMTPDGPMLREDVWFWADGNPDGGDYEKPRPSMHMPRWASRLTLIVTDVRVERLQDCSEADAIAEGIEPTGLGNEEVWKNYAGERGFLYAVNSYKTLWDDINDKAGTRWTDNPWVAAYTFRVIKQNIDKIAEDA